ncbi:MAG TPA: hypothetical protein VL094_02680 [Sphingomonadaceae bacterium]|nr:hypothetical protein [Sphingomonadaceae bacterium]
MPVDEIVGTAIELTVETVVEVVDVLGPDDDKKKRKLSPWKILWAILLIGLLALALIAAFTDFA